MQTATCRVCGVPLPPGVPGDHEDICQGHRRLGTIMHNPARRPPTRYPLGKCPACGGSKIVYTGSQVCGTEEAWEDGMVVVSETGDWYGWVGPIRGRCQECNHEWEE